MQICQKNSGLKHSQQLSIFKIEVLSPTKQSRERHHLRLGLKVFGCLCYSHVAMDERKCIMLGYGEESVLQP